jgi:hypothetical protein
MKQASKLTSVLIHESTIPNLNITRKDLETQAFVSTMLNTLSEINVQQFLTYSLAIPVDHHEIVNMQNRRDKITADHPGSRNKHISHVTFHNEIGISDSELPILTKQQASSICNTRKHS